jgi:hypothetical protein
MGVADRCVHLFQSNLRLEREAAPAREYMTLPGPMKTVSGSDGFGGAFEELDRARGRPGKRNDVVRA